MPCSALLYHAYTTGCLEKGSNLEEMTEALHIVTAIRGRLHWCMACRCARSPRSCRCESKADESSAAQNIILIGMPGSGKSTVGVILAKRLSRGFIDTDL